MRAVPEDRYLNREALDCILEDYSKNDLDRKIVVQESRKVSFIAVKEIIYLESQGNYTYLHITKGSKILSSNSLKVFEDMLPETAFMRVHKSFIININHLLSYNKEEGGFITMVNGSEVSVSRRRKNNFIERLKKRFS
jgi:two-component system LytT family response regulator